MSIEIPLSTSTYLDQVAPSQDFSQERLGCLAGLSRAHSNHPLLMKTAIVFLLSLGIALMATMPLTKPLLAL